MPQIHEEIINQRSRDFPYCRKPGFLDFIKLPKVYLCHNCLWNDDANTHKSLNFY